MRERRNSQPAARGMERCLYKTLFKIAKRLLEKTPTYVYKTVELECLARFSDTSCRKYLILS